MLYIATSSDAKSHILGGVSPGVDARVVTTVCGLTKPEYDFTHVSEDGSNVCSRCEGKVDVTETVDTKPEPVVDSTPVETPKSETRTGSPTPNVEEVVGDTENTKAKK